MARIVSNRIQVEKALLGLSTAFSLRRKIAGGKRLGQELIETAAAAIEDRTANRQADPTGQPLAPLRPMTIRRKLLAGLDPRILIETHEMLNFGNLVGRTSITEHQAVMSAGLDAYTQQKVEWAHEGAPNRRKRPFYDLGKDGEAKTEQLFEEVKDNAIREAERV